MSLNIVEDDLVCPLPGDMIVPEVSLSYSRLFRSSSRLYEPLLEEYSFRLLILHPSTSKDAPIACSLIAQSLKEAPDYTALSYEWGEPTPAKHIWVNGMTVRVTPNLHLALTHLRNRVPGVLWVDALCINQRDTQERGHQVARMRDIYSQAHHVVSWLGPASAALRSSDLNEVMEDICGRTYWRRVWIIQEFLRARAVILMCGDVHFREHDSKNEHHQVRHGVTRLISFGQLRQRSVPFCEWKFCESLFNSYCNRRDMRNNPFEWRDYTLDGVVTLGMKSDASDPRDAIYGVLGLLENREAKHVEIDYTLSACEVFCVTLLALEYRKSRQEGPKSGDHLPFVQMRRADVKHWQDFLGKSDGSSLVRFHRLRLVPRRRGSIPSAQQRQPKLPPFGWVSKLWDLYEISKDVQRDIKTCQGTCGTRELLERY